MKEYKILHVQEEHPRKLTEGNWHAAHDHLWTEQVLKLYTDAGYMVVQMAPDVCADHSLDHPHHLHGYTFLLEREAANRNHRITPAEVDAINALTPGDYPYLNAQRLKNVDFRSLFPTAGDPEVSEACCELEQERLDLERDLDFEIFFQMRDPEDHTP